MTGPVDQRLLARGAAVHLAWCVALGVAGAALVVAQAELLASAIAAIADGRSTQAVVVGLLAVTLGRSLVGLVTDRASVTASARAKAELRHEVLVATARTAAGRGVDRGRVASLLTQGIESIDAYIGQYLPALAVAAVVPLAVVVRLVTLDLTAAFTVAVTVPLIPVFMALVGRLTQDTVTRRHRELDRLSRHVLDVAVGMPTLVLFGRGQAQVASVRETSQRSRRATLATLRIAFLSALVLEVIATLSVALVAVGVGLRLVDGGLDLRTGLLLIILAPEAYFPLRRLGVEHHAAEDAVVVMDTIDELVAASVDPGPVGDRAVPRLGEHSSIEVRAVGVEQPGRGVVAPDAVSATVRAGQVTAVVGPSGAGKTTLLRLLASLLRPDTGEIVVHGEADSVDLSLVAPRSWQDQVTYVAQAPFVVAGTLADNLLLAAPDATPDAVDDALDAVGLGPLGAAHRVGTAGAGLSVGERRRLGIARAVIRSSAVVLLDEPTAGLDPDNVVAVTGLVARLAASGAIVVVATHRTDLAAGVDRVVEVVARAVPVTARTGVGS